MLLQQQGGMNFDLEVVTPRRGGWRGEVAAHGKIEHHWGMGTCLVVTHIL